MKISQLDEINGSTFSTKGLLSYLSEIVLSTTDEDIRKKKESLGKEKKLIESSKEELRSIKESLITESVKKKRLISLYNVLNTIDTLRKEGLLIGSNRAKVSKILQTVKEKDFRELRTLDERLALYLPDNHITRR
jgi:hypothetical protein